jgi:hypothetical protein
MARKRDEFFNDRGDHGFFSTLVWYFYTWKVDFCLKVRMRNISKKAKCHSLVKNTHAHSNTHMVSISWAFLLQLFYHALLRPVHNNFLSIN